LKKTLTSGSILKELTGGGRYCWTSVRKFKPTCS
jgi:hypothetical protein